MIFVATFNNADGSEGAKTFGDNEDIADVDFIPEDLSAFDDPVAPTNDFVGPRFLSGSDDFLDIGILWIPPIYAAKAEKGISILNGLVEYPVTLRIAVLANRHLVYSTSIQREPLRITARRQR
ncbi:hypothetical protein B2G71_12920 [Novosphingobium sp. PC22D]|nr:hypothetical protein B2G71_12920 [Novosphingobium sp. PC22D]